MCNGIFRFVYGHNSTAQRRSLHEDLISISSHTFFPWVLTGDFNIVMSKDDRHSRGIFYRGKIDEFVCCCSIIELSDAPTVGQYYIWSNK